MLAILKEATNIDFYCRAVFFYDNSMDSERNRHPLVFLDTTVIMGIQIGKTAILIKRILFYVKARGINVRPQNIHAFRHRLLSDLEHHDRFIHPDGIYIVMKKILNGLEGMGIELRAV